MLSENPAHQRSRILINVLRRSVKNGADTVNLEITKIARHLRT